MTPDSIKHLEFIQSTIARLAGNSFTLKGWSVTVVAALFALAAKDANEKYVVIAFLPAFCFWWLDAFYLRQERLFRKLYDHVRRSDSSVELFSMDTSDANLQTPNTFKTLFAPVVITYHIPLLIAIAIAVWYL